MNNMHTDLPKTVNEALKILAYNEFFWHDSLKSKINPHPKDLQTVRSLAESQYAWTEKQARLALIILKRYLTKFQAHGMDISKLLNEPVYEAPFRKIDWEKVIEKYQNNDGEEQIHLKFPYNKKIISLIRCLKDKKGLPHGYCHYDGDSKTWNFVQTELTTYYLTLVAVRYDFKFVEPSLLDEYLEVKTEKLQYKRPIAVDKGAHIELKNVSDSLLEYWDNEIKQKIKIQQADTLKNLGISARNIHLPTGSDMAKKIALNLHHKLWIDSKEYSRFQIVNALDELDAFPILMPVNGDLRDEAEVRDMWAWLRTFESIGIDILKQISFGFEIKEPRHFAEEGMDDYSFEKFRGDKESFENCFELHQMSRQFKFIDKKTKVLFVRNKIPRTLLRSKIKPKASIITIGGGLYSGGTENLKRLLENLPKKLYYSESRPSSFDWNDQIIIKL